MNQSGGIVNRASGMIVTDSGTAAALTITLGFDPAVVIFHNVTDRISDEWYAGMAAASSLHTVAAGTRTLELVNGVTPVSKGFSVNATTMLASKEFHWEATGA
jgi:hypothetical protein